MQLRYELIYTLQYQLHFKQVAVRITQYNNANTLQKASSALLSRAYDLNDGQQKILIEVKKVVDASASVAKSTIYVSYVKHHLQVAHVHVVGRQLVRG